MSTQLLPATGRSGAVLRPYQVEIVDDVESHLKSGGRGQVRAACGSGKTLMALELALRLCLPGGIVVLLFPSLALIRQTLTFWARMSIDHDVLAVCCDDQVADSAVTISDIPATVTTDADLVAKWLHTTTSPLRLLVGTYASVDRMCAGMQQAGCQADIMICDEAHHTAGSAVKKAGLVHAQLPAARRLYMTATGRIERSLSDAVLSMDDEELFGPIVGSYPFARGIAEGYLDDFRVAALGVTRPEVRSLLKDLTNRSSIGDAQSNRSRILLAQIALVKAVKRFNLKRIIVFCPRVADAREFAATLPSTVRSLNPEDRPTGVLTSASIDWTIPGVVRDELLGMLAHPPQSGWTVIANARCLTEGVDVPEVDAVLFTAPRRSPIVVVQAVGRALRRSPEAGQSVATIVAPFLLPDDPEDLSNLQSAGEFATVLQVLDGMRAHDGQLAVQLNESRAKIGGRSPAATPGAHPSGHATAATQDTSEVLPDRFVLEVPASYSGTDLFSALTVHILRSATSSWWESWGNARTFFEREGHLNVPKGRVENGMPLDVWLHVQRTLIRKGKLTDEQREALGRIGFVLEPRGERFTQGLRAHVTWRRREGDRGVPEDHIENGVRLRNWQGNTRQSHRNGTLSACQICRLGIAGFSLAPNDEWFDLLLTLLVKFKKREGYVNVPVTHSEDGHKIGQQLRSLKTAARKGNVTAAREKALVDIGVVLKEEWREEHYQGMVARLRAFKKREGHVNLPRLHMEDGARLGHWTRTQQVRARQGTLRADRRKILEALGLPLY